MSKFERCARLVFRRFLGASNIRYEALRIILLIGTLSFFYRGGLFNYDGNELVFPV